MAERRRGPAPAGATLRARGRVAWFGVLAGVGLAGVVRSLAGRADGPDPVALVLSLALMAVGLLQSRTRVVLGPGGLTVVNPLATRYLPWSEVEEFRLRRGRAVLWVGVAALRSGEEVVLRGIQPLQRMRWPRSVAPLEQALARLNQAAASRRGA